MARASTRTALAMLESEQHDLLVQFQRAYWHLHINEVFDQLSYLQFEAGELEVAIETVSRWLVLASLHEDASRRLMRLH